MANLGGKTELVTIAPDGEIIKVTPGEIDISAGDKVNFINKTDGLVTLMFSEDLLFPVPDEEKKIKAGDNRLLKAEKVQRGIYTYAVFCACNNEFAIASSMPIIIIRK